jgi:hypothetical protein
MFPWEHPVGTNWRDGKAHPRHPASGVKDFLHPTFTPDVGPSFAMGGSSRAPRYPTILLFSNAALGERFFSHKHDSI